MNMLLQWTRPVFSVQCYCESLSKCLCLVCVVAMMLVLPLYASMLPVSWPCLPTAKRGEVG